MGRIPKGGEVSAGTRNEKDVEEAVEWQVIKASFTVYHWPGPGPALHCLLTPETPEAEGQRILAACQPGPRSAPGPPTPISRA